MVPEKSPAYRVRLFPSEGFKTVVAILVEVIFYATYGPSFASAQIEKLLSVQSSLSLMSRSIEHGFSLVFFKYM